MYRCIKYEYTIYDVYICINLIQHALTAIMNLLQLVQLSTHTWKKQGKNKIFVS